MRNLRCREGFVGVVWCGLRELKFMMARDGAGRLDWRVGIPGAMV